MSEKDKIVVTDPNNVQIVFVNQVLGQGHVNGVINLTMGAARFTPSSATGNVEVDMVVASRLRMDLVCAQQLRDSLDDILSKVIPPETPTVQ